MKKGTRICAAGLLALTMALGSAPVLGAIAPTVALANDGTTSSETVTVGKDEVWVLRNNKLSKADSLKDAIEKASAGDTICLGEGEYKIANGTKVKVPVNIKGAGAGLTTIKGSIWMENDNNKLNTNKGDEVSISDLTVSYDKNLDQNQYGLYIAKPTQGLTANVDNVELKGFRYGVVVDAHVDKNDDLVVNLTNVKTDGVWTVVSFTANEDTQVNVSLTEDSNYVYAAEVIGEDTNRSFYGTVADYAAGENAVVVNSKGKVVTDDAADKDDFETNPARDTDKGGYYAVATNEGVNYTKLYAALKKVDKGETVSVVADTTVAADSFEDWALEVNDVTLEGNGHTVIFNDTLDVNANNFTCQNVTLAAGDANAITFAGNGKYNYTSTLRDVAINNAAKNNAVIKLNNGSLTVEGNLEVTPNVTGAAAGIEVYGTASVDFAADATVSFRDVSVKGVLFAKLYCDKNGVTGSVTSANPAMGIATENVDANNDGKFAYIDDYEDYTAVSVHMHNYEVQGAVDATETTDGYTGDKVCTVCDDTIEGQTIPATGYADVVMTRLYNRFSGEHLYTGDQNEIDTLVKLRWTNEGTAWTAPGMSETPVYRLYNPYTGEHFYTTDEAEYNTLAEVGWNQEGICWYSADADATPVFRLYNPYAVTGTHHFTTDANEVVELVKLGWINEGTAWYAK